MLDRRELLTGRFQTPSQTPSPTIAPADADFAAWAESIELALVTIYNQAMPRLTADNVATASRFRDHHQDHAGAYATLAAAKATGKANSALIFTTAPAVQALADQPSALNYLIGLENQMAETYAYNLNLLTSTDVYSRVVTTLPIESQHAAVLGSVLGLPVDSMFITGPFENATVGDGTDPRRGFDVAVFPLG
jgi:hypothetical protein